MQYLRNRFGHIFAIGALVVAALAQSPSPDHLVSVPVANMYSSATNDSNVVSQAIRGTNVVTIESRGEWAKIQTPDGYSGWTAVGVLRSLRDSHPYAASGDTVQVACVERSEDVIAIMQKDL